MVKKNHLNNINLTRQDYKNSYVTIKNIFQKKKKRKEKNVQGIDLIICMIRKNKK